MMHRTIGLASPPSLADLIAGGPVSLFLDFDGTLVELAPQPDGISVPDQIATKLTYLANRLDRRCALVSGRSVDDLRHYVGEAEIGWAGSHGLDVRDIGGNQLSDVPNGFPADLEQALTDFAAKHELRFEQKPHGGALHYRQSPEKGDLAHEFVEKLAAEHGWHAQSGKCVAELVPRKASKGEAVYAFMKSATFAGSRPFFLGDDLTDEAGFEASAKLGGAGIIVGERAVQNAETKAKFALPDVTSVHEWLAL